VETFNKTGDQSDSEIQQEKGSCGEDIARGGRTSVRGRSQGWNGEPSNQIKT